MMNLNLLSYFSAILLLVSSATASPFLNLPNVVRARNHILPRQAEPTAFTTARTANTEFAPPQTVTPPDTAATGTQTTTHEANTENIPATTTGTPPPVYSDSTRGANTQAIAPVTVNSTAYAVPTGVMRMDVVLGGVVAGIAGML